VTTGPGELTGAKSLESVGRRDNQARRDQRPGQELLARCRAYCHFALEHPVHYKVMFHLDLSPSLAANPMAPLSAGDFDEPDHMADAVGVSSGG